MLTVNQRIPPFDGITPEGTRVHVDHFLGRKLWIGLYRYAGCPLCTIHLAELHRRLNALSDAGVTVLAIFNSPAGKLMGSTGKFPLARSRVPLLADPDGLLHGLLLGQRSVRAWLGPAVSLKWAGAMLKGYRQGEVSGDLNQLPAHFLVGPDGLIQQAYYGRHAADHIPWRDVERFAGGPLAQTAIEDARAQSLAPPPRSVAQESGTFVTNPGTWSNPGIDLRKVAPELMSIAIRLPENPDPAAEAALIQKGHSIGPEPLLLFSVENAKLANPKRKSGSEDQ